MFLIKKTSIALLLSLSFSANSSVENVFKYRAIDNIKISTIEIEDPLKEFEKISNTGKTPICESNFSVGEIDCFGRLYVDNNMLSELVNGNSIFVNDVEYNSYSDTEINTYHVTSLRKVFNGLDVEHSIVNWDTRNVTDIRDLFAYSRNFNQDISRWDMGNVKSFSGAFLSATSFNQDLTGWNTCGSPTYSGSGFRYSATSEGFKSPLFQSCITDLLYEELRYDEKGRLIVSREILDLIIKFSHERYVGIGGFTTADGIVIKTTYSGDDINTSEITTSRTMFNNLSEGLNYDISGWDVSNITTMERMFSNTYIENLDLSNWDISSLTNVSRMFNESIIIGDLNLANWDVSEVRNMYEMFRDSLGFNEDISHWNTCSATQHNYFNRGSDLEDSNTPYFKSCVEKSFDELEYDDLGRLFVNRDILNKIISNDESMNQGAFITNDGVVIKISYSDSDINTSYITNLSDVFYRAENIRHSISGWDVSNVTKMDSMFSGSSGFNQNISGWDVSSVTSMYRMFENSSGFNQDISVWNTSKVANMYEMFKDSSDFNQDISSWNVCNVTSNNRFNGGSDLEEENIPRFNDC